MSRHGTGHGDTEELLTLDALASRLPRPSATDRAALLDDASRDALIELGAQIDSNRVVTDCARLYPLAYEFWRSASDAQKHVLVGFSPELLAVAVGEALALRAAVRGTHDAGHADTTTQEQLSAVEREAFHAGLSARDHARAVFKMIAGRNAVARAAVDAAAGTAEDGEALANGIDALAKWGREALHSHDPKVRARVSLARLDEAYVRTLDALAAKLREATAAATAPRTKAKAAQGNLDYADGVNLHLLGEVIHVFEAAHDVDATVPRLVPIATRRLLGRAGRRAKKPDGAPGSAGGGTTSAAG